MGNLEKLAELKSLYFSLYETGYDLLLSRIEMHIKERSASLKALDKKRQSNPLWYLSSDMIGLTMYSDLFAGNLVLLKDKIPYLKRMGIKYLHLMPLMQMPHTDNDGGYAVEDFNNIDPKFGTNEDLEALTAELRKNGISLCMDFVMNHTASTHAWAKAAEEGNEKYQGYYFTYTDRTIPDEYEKTVPEVFPSTAPGNFIYSQKMGKWVLSSFYPYQWDLNYGNPEVFIEMVSSMLKMANLGVEVFRLDAVPYIWKKLGTSCRNLPEVHTLVRMIRLVLELAAPAVILKGEVVMAPKELSAYFGTKAAPECHLLYGVSSMVNLWSALASQDALLLYDHMEKILSLPEHCAFVNYLRCHDDIGWGLDEDKERMLGIDPLGHKKFLYNFYSGEFPLSYARGQLYNHDFESGDARSCGTTASLCGLERALIDHDPLALSIALDRIKLMHSVLYSLKGFPMLSSGDEIAQLNDYSYMNDYDRASDSRNLHRSHYDWAKAALVKKKGTYQNSVYSFLTLLRKIRKDEPCFKEDAEVMTWHTNNRSVFALRRKKDGRDLLCVFNFSDKEQTASFDYFLGTYKDFFTCFEYEPGCGITLKPYGFVYLIKES